MPATARKTAPVAFRTLEYPALDPAAAEQHARLMLHHHTDPSDLHADLEAGCDAIVVLDARSRDSY
ncbi:MAG TPA: rhodanese-like domain-containing protein, partial [Gammaproteobacteria bacterium]|nr:rhodanese-like domain-containing protein [Gammaproteobacteria bacterium]